MDTDEIYKILAEVTGEEAEYLRIADGVQMIRPSEVVEVVEIILSRSGASRE